MPDSPPWNKYRYYQDAAIRAAFEKILLQFKRAKILGYYYLLQQVQVKPLLQQIFYGG